METILITGNLGFIFSHVTEYFLDKGWHVYGIDNHSEGSHPELIDEWLETGRYSHFRMDVSDPRVDSIIRHINPSYIVHAAAISDVDYSIKYPLLTIEKNCSAINNVFEAARFCTNLKKLLYVSTDEVAGECDHKKKEDEIIFPKNPYALSKAYGSLLRLAYDNTYPELKDKTCETRFCNVFGGRQDSRKILGIIKKALEENITIPVHNEGKGYREYLYVKNIPPLIDLILDKGNQTYNVTLNEGFTVKNLIERVESVTNKKINTIPSNRPGMDLQYQLHNGRILALGWKPLYSFDEGLKDYLKYEDNKTNKE